MGHEEVLFERLDLQIVLELHAAIFLLGALAGYLDDESWIDAGVVIERMDFIRAIDREVGVVADPTPRRGEHGEPLVRPLEQTRPLAKRRSERVVKSTTEQVVPARSPGHRDDFAIDQLVPFRCLAFEAEILREIDGPRGDAGNHPKSVASGDEHTDLLPHAARVGGTTLDAMPKNENLVAEYERVLPVLRERGAAVSREIEALLAAEPSLKVHSVAWRCKATASLAQKLARPDRSYDSLWMLTDLVGVRVITYFADAVERVGELIETRLPVDFARSVDKRRHESPEFGYRSLHYICRLPSVDGALPATACFEIQVRTMLEHTWAEIEHDLGYKATEEIPLAVRRRLGRLAGLLELADQEFGAIRRELETYARALPARIATEGQTVPLDRFSLAALLECAEVRSVDLRISSVLQNDLGDEPFYPDYLLKMLAFSGVRTTDQARRGVDQHGDVIEAMVRPYFTLAEQLWQLSPQRMPSTLRGYSLFFLAHVEVLRASTLRLEKIERLARLYRELDYPNDAKTAHHVASQLVDALSQG